MIPPTPTLLPLAVPHVVMPDGYSIWAGTSSAVTVWNMAGQWQTVLQGIIIIGIVIIGITIVWKFIRQMTNRDSQQ